MKLKRLFAVWAVPVLLGAGPLFGDPAITSFTPTFGASADPSYITITGSGFNPGTLVVRFNGVQDLGASANAADGTSIQAHVPVGATNGTNPIFVSVNDVGTYSVQDFTVIGPGPYITDFSPTTGSSGAPVTINGTHFTGVTGVKFNGKSAAFDPPTTDTQMKAYAPSGVTSGRISVTTSLGTHTNAGIFYVPPVVTGFAPAAGRAATNVIITGTNFLGTTAVRFNGLDATNFNVLSNGAIQASVPVNATTGPIRVIAPAGSIFTTSNFVVQPTITGFTPGFGSAGTNVTITGANFNVGTPVVKFNGVQAAAPTSVTFSNLTAVVPAGATTGPITVTNSDGTVTSTANFFVSAVITSFTPSNSAPGTLVAIKGTNFTSASNVTFDGTPAAGFYVTNNTSLGAFVPAGVTSGPISVTTPAGTVSSSTKFYGAPVISGFNPAHGLPGTNVVISGQSFLDASSVRFNGLNATFSVVNNTTINATVPANASTGPITVIAPAGTNTSAQSFTLDYTANLSLTVSDAPDPIVVGNHLLYTITIANGGPYVAPGVTFTDTLPGTVNLIAATTTQGTLNTNANPVTGNLGQLGVGANLTITLTVSPQATGSITNFATVASLYPDPTPANNSAANATFVQPLPILGVKALSPNLVRLSWPSALTNYGLEFKSVITSAVWSPVPTQPLTVGSESQVTETNNQSPRYYRLRRLP
jgi:hypothetical protein